MTTLSLTGDPADVFVRVRGWVRDGGKPLVIRTSGSTGEPKDVILSHRAVVSSATASLERLGGHGGWVVAMPVTGVGGLQVLVRSVLAGLEPVHAAAFASLGDAIEAIPGDRRYASLVPTQVHRLVEAGQVDALRSLDGLLVGGAAVPPSLLEALDGVRVVRTYGMSETSGGCVYDGVPFDQVEVRLDAAGQVLLAGPVLFDGYVDPVATARVLRDGWFATNDLGEIDPSGRLRITGRSDDVVISGGVNVPLPPVTEVLRGMPGVREAVALGAPDAEWGSRVVAYVVASAPVPDLAQVRDAVESAGHPRTWAPRELVLLDALPLLPGGKIDRRALLG